MIPSSIIQAVDLPDIFVTILNPEEKIKFPIYDNMLLEKVWLCISESDKINRPVNL